MYRMLKGESVSQNQTPADKLRALIRLTPRYAEFEQDMAAAIQRQEGKENAAALVTLMSDKKNLRIELEVAWFSSKYKDYKITYPNYVHYGLGNRPNVLRQLLEIDIPRKAAVRAALEESFFDLAVYATLSKFDWLTTNTRFSFSQYALDPTNARDGDDDDLNDAVLQEGAAQSESFGIEDEDPVHGDENQRKCWMYLNSVRDVLSNAAAVDAAVAVNQETARAVRRLSITSCFLFIHI
jgi:hypothetical protein